VIVGVAECRQVQMPPRETLRRFAAHIDDFAAKQHSSACEFRAGFGGVAVMMLACIKDGVT